MAGAPDVAVQEAGAAAAKRLDKRLATRCIHVENRYLSAALRKAACHSGTNPVWQMDTDAHVASIHDLNGIHRSLKFI